MTLQEYVEDIKLDLTGGLLQLEITDETIGQVVNKALREIQRYIDITKLVTVPFSKCIDLKDFNYSSITAVYRVNSFLGNDDTTLGMADPMYAQQWLIFGSGASMYNLQNYMLNYMAYNTFNQIRNTTSTDLDFKEDKLAQKLYINVSYDIPNMITIEYVPKYYTVEDINSDYWINILYRLSLAQTKIILGRIRSKYKQSNALWTLDGDQLLEEGNTELENLREILRSNAQLFFPKD